VRPETRQRAVELHGLGRQQGGVQLDGTSIELRPLKRGGWKEMTFQFDAIITKCLFDAIAYGRGDLRKNDLLIAYFMPPE
jgi:hypothetical protein